MTAAAGLRLREKGGKEHELPRNHNLEEFLDEYVAAGIAGDPDGLIFRTTGRQTGLQPAHMAAGRLPHDPAPRQGRRDRDENWKHTLRAIGISTYLRNDGKPERADHGEPLLAAHHQALRQTGGGDFPR